jgi:hypothetical protein
MKVAVRCTFQQRHGDGRTEASLRELQDAGGYGAGGGCRAGQLALCGWLIMDDLSRGMLRRAQAEAVPKPDFADRAFEFMGNRQSQQSFGPSMLANVLDPFGGPSAVASLVHSGIRSLNRHQQPLPNRDGRPLIDPPPADLSKLGPRVINAEPTFGDEWNKLKKSNGVGDAVSKLISVAGLPRVLSMANRTASGMGGKPADDQGNDVKRIIEQGRTMALSDQDRMGGHSMGDGHDHGGDPLMQLAAVGDGPSSKQEHPAIAAARKSGADVDGMLRAGDIRGITAAAEKGDPSLGGDSGMMMLEDFAKQAKQQMGLTERELPGSRNAREMAGTRAPVGPSGRPRPLQRPYDDDPNLEADQEAYRNSYKQQYGDPKAMGRMLQGR